MISGTAGPGIWPFNQQSAVRLALRIRK